MCIRWSAGALGLEAARRGRVSQSMDLRGPECILEMANTILVEASNAFHAEHLTDKVAIKLLSSAYGNCSRALMGLLDAPATSSASYGTIGCASDIISLTRSHSNDPSIDNCRKQFTTAADSPPQTSTTATPKSPHRASQTSAHPYFKPATWWETQSTLAANALETVCSNSHKLLGSLSFIRVLEHSDLTIIVESLFVDIDGPVHYHNYEPRSSAN